MPYFPKSPGPQLAWQPILFWGPWRSARHRYTNTIGRKRPWVPPRARPDRARFVNRQPFQSGEAVQITFPPNTSALSWHTKALSRARSARRLRSAKWDKEMRSQRRKRPGKISTRHLHRPRVSRVSHARRKPPTRSVRGHTSGGTTQREQLLRHQTLSCGARARSHRDLYSATRLGGTSQHFGFQWCPLTARLTYPRRRLPDSCQTLMLSHVHRFRASQRAGHTASRHLHRHRGLRPKRARSRRLPQRLPWDRQLARSLSTSHPLNKTMGPTCCQMSTPRLLRRTKRCRGFRLVQKWQAPARHNPSSEPCFSAKVQQHQRPYIIPLVRVEPLQESIQLSFCCHLGSWDLCTHDRGTTDARTFAHCTGTHCTGTHCAHLSAYGRPHVHLGVGGRECSRGSASAERKHCGQGAICRLR